MVVTIRPFLRAFIGCFASASLSFTKGIPIKVAKIPKALAISGKNRNIRFPVAMLIKPPMTIPPMFSPVADSNRSAPLPAESPTLSPTLSAMTCRVTWVIFRNTCFNFAYKVGSDVCSFSVDSAVQAGQITQ